MSPPVLAVTEPASGPRAFAAGEPLDRAALLAAPLRWPCPSRLERQLGIPAGKLTDGLTTLGVQSVGALLEHLPRERRAARTISELGPGEQATIEVEVRAISRRPVRRRGMRPLVEATVFDATGTLRATFFNQPWLVERYPPGTRLLLHGKAARGGAFNVAYHALGTELGAAATAAGVAHYPAAEGVSSTQILTLVREHRAGLADIVEPLPAALRAAEDLPARAAALDAMHFPRDEHQAEAARRRLAFEELLLMQLAVLRRRALRGSGSATALTAPRELTARWLAELLPFEPTAEQHAAMAAIDADLAHARPMQRLLMGEVGSGKTVVALYALLRAVEHGMQGVLMAPTETLAEQHFATLQTLVPAALLPSALLSGSTPARRRADVLGKLASGELSLIVGTHALIEADVAFDRLAVAVVDEQHRFGVRQRAALDRKGPRGLAPHVLHMTATPIPRTLALTEYGDLDVTRLRELPRGRQPIATHVVTSPAARARAYERVREELRAGRQAYIVCPLVEESEQLQARAASAEFERLRTGELRDFEVELLHGQLPAREKQRAMARFNEGAAQVLVATTVIEVGVDVPNATVMLVEDAERYGISQLHQLRGRIGRGEHPSVCLLFGPHGSRRLQALAESGDGFQLAEIDLQLRGEGELAGVRQSGRAEPRVASLPQDEELLERAHDYALRLLDSDPELAEPEHVLLGDALARAFGVAASEPIPA
ncbi:MAG TPA: ATP-dependent DNA helicase RecG [Solirubrobacteraceae bacterium]|jgi:ATP-dependent DNA helicase RecG|nr:ATP-dependent DNA helicase RecG [Solirubrobacteraceae bacterium]